MPSATSVDPIQFPKVTDSEKDSDILTSIQQLYLPIVQNALDNLLLV